MKTSKATMGQPEFDEEIRVPQFIWRVTRAWHPVKNNEEGLKNLWAGQQKLLEAFDLQFPDQRQPALTVPPALPTFPALQARPAPLTQALKITPAISPLAGPAPIPIRDCHGLLYPAGYSRRVQQGTGTGWVSPTRAIPVPPAGGWRVGPHIQTPREIDPNDARRIVWALCRYVFFLFFVFFSKLTHSL